MRRFRITLTGILIAVAGVAVACAAIRNATPFWAKCTFTVVFVALNLAVIAAIVRQPQGKVFPSGFATSGIAYLLVVYGCETTLGSYLFTPDLIGYVYSWRWQFVGGYSVTERRIIEKLEAPVSLEFRETPLSDVLTFLRNYLDDVNVVPDSRIGNLLRLPVTIHVEAIPLSSALKLLLEQHGLAFTVEDDVLLIKRGRGEVRREKPEVFSIGHSLFTLLLGAGGGFAAVWISRSQTPRGGETT